MTATTISTRSCLADRVARHLGTTVTHAGTMPCPACGGDYGPTIPLHLLSGYQLGYLPGAPVLVGVCLDCEHIHRPAAAYTDTHTEPSPVD